MEKHRKQIRWWPHARERLREREIDIKLVLEAIKQPDQIIFLGRRKVIHKRYYDFHRHKEYLLRIFIDEYTKEQVVCSVYRTSKIAKYWRDDL